MTEVMQEPHFAPKYWAKLWGMHETTALRIFRDRPGVFKLGLPSVNGKRTRCELRIPVSVAAAVYLERTGKAWT